MSDNTELIAQLRSYNEELTSYDAFLSVMLPDAADALAEQAVAIETVRKLLARKSHDLLDPELKDGWVTLDALREPCNCGWGGIHDPDNLRCQKNSTREPTMTGDNQ